jgi:hypothetical protein
MKIEETQLPDVSIKNLEESKVILAENIIKNVYPLFDDVYIQKLEEIKKLEQVLEGKKLTVKTEKEQLERLLGSYNKKIKITNLLGRLQKLVESGLVYDGTLRNDTVLLLKVIDKLSEEKVDYHIKQTIKLISTRFTR